MCKDRIIELQKFVNHSIKKYIDIVEGDNLIFICDPMPYEQAQEYCRREYGTDLGTISSDELMNEAVTLTSSAPENTWFGLYANRGGGSDSGNWGFLNFDECPNTESHFRCIDFWLYQKNSQTNFRPRCIGDAESGNKCAYFDPIRDGADNDIECTQPQGFFCNTPTQSM